MLAAEQPQAVAAQRGGVEQQALRRAHAQWLQQLPLAVEQGKRLGVVARAACCAARAMPKSAIFTRPSAVTIRFSGLRSRCTMPCCSAWASAGEQALEHAADLRQRQPPTYGRSDPRSTYSIAMYGVPSCSK